MRDITRDWKNGKGACYQLPFNITITWQNYTLIGTGTKGCEGTSQRKVLEIRWEKR